MWRASSLRAFGGALAAALFAIPARAVAEPAELSAYEARTVVESARRLGVRPELDPAPEGKWIERLDLVLLDVFDEHDPVPDFVNVLHVTTREHIVRRELLFAADEPYSAARADESARNLRRLRQLSLVLVVPLRGSAPDRVRVLVITRDVWSLRINVTPSGGVGPGGPTVTSLVVNPTEENFLGTHTTIGALFTLDPGSYSLGGLVIHRRILGTELEAAVGANVIYERATGDPEGAFGSFVYGAPLRTSDARWGFGTGIFFLNEIERRFDGARIARFDAAATPEDDALPIVYRRERLLGGFEVVRSFGRRHKYDVSVGVEVDRRANRYRHVPGADALAEAELVRDWVPLSDTRASPFVQLRTHFERYLRTIELETLALQEDYRLGPEVLLRAYPASRALASTRDLLGLQAGASYTEALGDGLARLVLMNTVEYELHGRHDASFEARARIATPRLGFGRFVADAIFLERYYDALRRQYLLGGDGRIRGYAPGGFQGSFSGAHAAGVTTEFRTGSIDILSAQVGLAAFHDAAHASDNLRDLSLRQSAGLGLRALFPQVNRVVFRIDWGFPLTPGYPAFPGGVFLTFGQAFRMPELETPSVMTADLE